MADAQEETQVEYRIIAHLNTKAAQEAGKDKEESELTKNMNKAISDAEAMLETGKYTKVEVMQKYFEPKTSRNIEMVLKSFEASDKKPISTTTILAIGIICAFIAFGASYFIGKSMAPPAEEVSEEIAEEE